MRNGALVAAVLSLCSLSTRRLSSRVLTTLNFHSSPFSLQRPSLLHFMATLQTHTHTLFPTSHSFFVIIFLHGVGFVSFPQVSQRILFVFIFAPSNLSAQKVKGLLLSENGRIFVIYDNIGNNFYYVLSQFKVKYLFIP